MPGVLVQAASAEQLRNLQLVLQYAGVQDMVDVQSGQELVLNTADGNLKLSGLNTICHYIAHLSDRNGELVGSDEPTRAHIAEWLSFRNTSLSPITEEKLLKISSHLLSRMYLVNSRLSLADLCLFASLHRAVVALPDAQTERYCSLIRWFDHIQHAVDKRDIFPKVSFRKPGLPDLPSAAVPPKVPKEVHAKQQATPASAANGVVPATAPVATPLAQGNAAAVTAAAAAPKNAHDPADGAPAHASDAPQLQDAKQAKKEARREARKMSEPKEAEPRIDMLDIRVGQIVDVEPHPNADALYVEQIDLGEEKPRQVVSGLRNFVPIEQMKGRRVVVCTNLKPAKMRDVMSYGMVLCASNKEHDRVDPLVPPTGASLGAKISFSGYSEEPLAEVNPKKKIVERLKEDLQTDSIGVATYKAVPFMCESGPITSSIPLALVG